MKINIQHRHYRGREAIEGLIHTRLQRLGQRRTITEALVRLEENVEQSPSCNVLVHLVTPGPDIVVQASDHSLAAAMIKADEKLHACIDDKAKKQAARLQRGAVRPQRLASAVHAAS